MNVNDIIYGLFDDVHDSPIFFLAHIVTNGGSKQIHGMNVKCEIYEYVNLRELESDIKKLKKENILILYEYYFKNGKIICRYAVISIYKQPLGYNVICDKRIKCLERNKKLNEILN